MKILTLTLTLCVMATCFQYHKTINTTVIKKEPQSAAKLREGVADALKKSN